MCIVASFIITKTTGKIRCCQRSMLSSGTSIHWNTTQSTTDTYPYLNDFQGNYAGEKKANSERLEHCTLPLIVFWNAKNYRNGNMLVLAVAGGGRSNTEGSCGDGTVLHFLLNQCQYPDCATVLQNVTGWRLYRISVLFLTNSMWMFNHHKIKKFKFLKKEGRRDG